MPHTTWKLFTRSFQGPDISKKMAALRWISSIRSFTKMPDQSYAITAWNFPSLLKSIQKSIGLLNSTPNRIPNMKPMDYDRDIWLKLHMISYIPMRQQTIFTRKVIIFGVNIHSWRVKISLSHSFEALVWSRIIVIFLRKMF